MSATRVCLLTASISLSACCVRPISFETFATSTLEQQVALYEEAIRGHCVNNNMITLLGRMASHGLPAADAMTALMKSPHPDFPLEHAMAVFAFTRFEGVNVHEHAGMAELRRLAESHPQPGIRAAATQELEAIEKYPAPTAAPQ